MVGFVLFWFVKRYTLPPGRGILLFIVNRKASKIYFCIMNCCGLHLTNHFVIMHCGMCIIQLRLGMLVGDLLHRGQ